MITSKDNCRYVLRMLYDAGAKFFLQRLTLVAMWCSQDAPKEKFIPVAAVLMNS